jgi:hypothetical protein
MPKTPRFLAELEMTILFGCSPKANLIFPAQSGKMPSLFGFNFPPLAA